MLARDERGDGELASLVIMLPVLALFVAAAVTILTLFGAQGDARAIAVEAASVVAASPDRDSALSNATAHAATLAALYEVSSHVISFEVPAGFARGDDFSVTVAVTAPVAIPLLAPSLTVEQTHHGRLATHRSRVAAP